MSDQRDDKITKEDVVAIVREFLVLEYNYEAGFKLSDVTVVNGPEEIPIKEKPEFLTAKYKSDVGSGTLTRTLAEVVKIVNSADDYRGLEIEPVIIPRPSSKDGKGLKVEYFEGFEVTEPS